MSSMKVRSYPGWLKKERKKILGIGKNIVWLNYVIHAAG
jgi:hypothetical protein